ncbi:hypothetical protein B0H13DRAFT_2291877 [Mycena leptocephala]|nr:hypothetical protein B0H13DRAFT_2291877 [Mycena leptocephala]
MCLLLLRPPRNARQRARLERKKSGQGVHRRHSMPCSMRNDCTRRLVSAHPPIPSTLRCHIARHRVAQHPARSSTTPSVPVAASSMDDRRPVHASLRAEPKVRRLHPALHHVISIHVSISPHVASPPTRLGSSNPSPPIQRRFSRSTFSEPPGIRLWRPQATIRLRSGPHARKIRTLRTTSWSRPRRPPRPATQALAMRRPAPFLRASGSSAIASPHPACTHDPRTSLRLLSGHPHNYVVRNVFTYCRHSAQSPLSPCYRRVRRQPPRIPCPDREHSESHYQLSMSHPPSISLSRTTYTSFSDCRVEYSPS